mmetsp:Transcript_24392/g.34980  ORF Transcript_24392/g.34980 Transcript_24392/m.34980 type:complete len:90 (+) Transcript_24392:611-880(+)
MSTSGSDPALLSLIENLVTAQGGVAICSETNINWRRQKFVHEVRKQLQEANTIHMSTMCSSMGDSDPFRNKRFLPGGAAIFTFNHWTCN